MNKLNKILANIFDEDGDLKKVPTIIGIIFIVLVYIVFDSMEYHDLIR